MPEPKQQKPDKSSGSEKQPEIIQQQEQKEAIEMPIQSQDLQKNNQETQLQGEKSIKSGIQTAEKMAAINKKNDS